MAGDDRMYLGHRVVSDILSDFDQIFWFVGRSYIIRNIKFHGNPFSESRADTCERTDGQRDGQKDVTKLVRVFRDYANAWFNLAL